MSLQLKLPMGFFPTFSDSNANGLKLIFYGCVNILRIMGHICIQQAVWCIAACWAARMTRSYGPLVWPAHMTCLCDPLVWAARMTRSCDLLVSATHVSRSYKLLSQSVSVHWDSVVFRPGIRRYQSFRWTLQGNKNYSLHSCLVYFY